jgi:hypothetical protein
MDEASDDEYAAKPATNVRDGHASATTHVTQSPTMMYQESNARRLEFETKGMREGYEAGKEETVQEGFDAGFDAALCRSFAWGRAMGAAAVLGVETAASSLSADEIKAQVCDALWEELGEMKDRFPERRTRAGAGASPEHLDEVSRLVAERMYSPSMSPAAR